MNEKNPYAAPASNLETKKDANTPAELATRGARFGGAIIDAVISILVTFPLMWLTGYWDSAMSGQTSMLQTIMLGVVALVMYFVIHGYFLAKDGQTVGKKIVKTRIVSIESDEILPLSKIFLLRVLPLNVVANLPVIGGLLAIADALFVFRKDQRCVHDLIAGTKVIKA